MSLKLPLLSVAALSLVACASTASLPEPTVSAAALSDEAREFGDYAVLGILGSARPGSQHKEEIWVCEDETCETKTLLTEFGRHKANRNYQLVDAGQTTTLFVKRRVYDSIIDDGGSSGGDGFASTTGGAEGIASQRNNQNRQFRCETSESFRPDRQERYVVRVITDPKYINGTGTRPCELSIEPLSTYQNTRF